MKGFDFLSNSFKYNGLGSYNNKSLGSVNRQLQKFYSNGLNDTFSKNKKSSVGSFFNNIVDSFNTTIDDFMDTDLLIDNYSQQDKKQSVDLNPFANILDTAGDQIVNLKYTQVTIKYYNRDYDINGSGEIGNRDNWNDNIDISASQHDYDFNNDGRVDGNQKDIDRLVKEIVNNRYLEKAEEKILGTLGIHANKGTQYELYFTDRLMPGERGKDGNRALAVSSDNPKIMLDLDEIITKGHGLDPKVIVHEMTHAIMYDKLRNDHQAAWFLEGAAVYTAGQGSEKISMALQQNGGTVNLRGLDQMQSSVHDLSGYAESYLAFEYIENFYGQDKVQDFIANAMELENVNLAIKKTFAINSSTFFQRAEQYVNSHINHFRHNYFA